MNLHLPQMPQVSDKRRFPRRRVLKQGRIILNNRFSVIDCMVRDISLGGCRIRLYAKFALPLHFILAFPALGVEREVALVWQNERDAGVRFLDETPPAFARLVPGVVRPG
jgi:hypothetical protein